MEVGGLEADVRDAVVDGLEDVGFVVEGETVMVVVVGCGAGVGVCFHGLEIAYYFSEPELFLVDTPLEFLLVKQAGPGLLLVDGTA